LSRLPANRATADPAFLKTEIATDLLLFIGYPAYYIRSFLIGFITAFLEDCLSFQRELSSHEQMLAIPKLHGACFNSTYHHDLER